MRIKKIGQKTGGERVRENDRDERQQDRRRTIRTHPSHAPPLMLAGAWSSHRRGAAVQPREGMSVWKLPTIYNT